MSPGLRWVNDACEDPGYSMANSKESFWGGKYTLSFLPRVGEKIDSTLMSVY